MDAYQAIIGKRDRREYDGRPIPEEVVQRILQAGRMAGSSSNSQPCRLILMQEKESLARIGPAGVGTGPERLLDRVARRTGADRVHPRGAVR